jgi:hypothetical protein
MYFAVQGQKERRLLLPTWLAGSCGTLLPPWDLNLVCRFVSHFFCQGVWLEWAGIFHFEISLNLHLPFVFLKLFVYPNFFWFKHQNRISLHGPGCGPFRVDYFCLLKSGC